ncbi:aldehyde dehydrogenase [halophilic archaeon]|nr:aldehyde dehydrogenase [halophilic archaeon]
MTHNTDLTVDVPAYDKDIDAFDLAPAGGWNALFVDGEWVSAGDRDTIDIVNPATQDSIGAVPAGTEAGVDEAYAAAEAAQSEWAARPPQARAEIVENARHLLDDYHDELIELFAVECGGIRLKGEIELDLVRNMMRMSEGLPFQLNGGHKAATIPGKESLIRREPLGVVGAITPWNFPLHLSMRVVAPALALGNAVVLKPAEETSLLGGLVFARLFEEAGLPDGLLNVVTGHGAEVGDYMSRHSTPGLISFTGSTEVGRQVGQNAVGQFTYPSLELGGNNAHIVTDDADLDRAVDGGVFGSFTHQGQECISINRHLVHESLYDEYVDRLAARAEELPVGDPSAEETIVGPVIKPEQRDKIVDFIEDSLAAGATLEAGGGHDGLFVEPTVLSDATNDMPAACNEHFGPVAPVIPFETDEEAVAMANDTEHGLSGSVHSTDLQRAKDIAEALDTGMVHINDQSLNDEAHTPFGGVNASGLGRYNGEWIMDELTQTKWISIQREPRDYPY